MSIVAWATTLSRVGPRKPGQTESMTPDSTSRPATPGAVLVLLKRGRTSTDVLVFTEPSRNPLAVLGRGLGAIGLNATSFLSDIISYIRLWAVGLAGGILASSFNEIAGPFPLPAAVLILVPAHALNLALGLVAVLAHGVRLNLLEFSNHLGMEWSGREYQPFRRQA